MWPEWAEGQPGRWTETSWTPPTTLTYSEWQRIGEALKKGHDRSKADTTTALWHLADWLNWGEGTFAERSAQALDWTDYDRRSLNNAARIASRFPPSRRRDPRLVTIWMHAEVEKLPATEADELLDRYADPEGHQEEGLYSRQDLRDARDSLMLSMDTQEPLEGIGDRPGMDTCPFCDGSGLVTHERRDALLLEEARGA